MFILSQYAISVLCTTLLMGDKMPSLGSGLLLLFALITFGVATAMSAILFSTYDSETESPKW